MESTAAAVATKLHLIKGDRHFLTSSDDRVMMKQIHGTHFPDGREVHSGPLLRLVEDILQRPAPTVIVTPQAHLELVEDKEHHVEVMGMLGAAYTIHKISCEITCKCSGGSDAHATTLALFNLLSNYNWDAKVVLALAAFAVSYGEFWLTAQFRTVNPLAKSVALLKQLPDILEHTDALKPRFDALNKLIKAMLDVTKCIIQFKGLPSEYISPDTPDMAMALAHIPTAVYWTIRSVVACAAQIVALIGLSHEYLSSTTEVWELSSLAHKVNSIYGHLTKQFELCNRHIAEKKHIEAYQTLVRLFETLHIDNLKILRALMCSKDDLPLFDDSSKKRVSVDVLRRKIVMLFISDLDISQEEIMVLTQIFTATDHGKPERSYEIVWLPMIDRHVPTKEDTFNGLAFTMPWYRLHHPSLLEPAVINYIRDVWHFDKKPLLVVLDPQGKVVCPNALPMMWIWGSLAFPFTSDREEALWKQETWGLEFLVHDMDPAIVESVRADGYVCLYGGEDIEWIRKFTKVMSLASEAAGVSIKMVYVGKSNARDRVSKAINVISNEKLSDFWEEKKMVRFWVRLESMWYSKKQHGRTIVNDPIMQEVMTTLSFDGSDEGWAVISRGSVKMVKAHGKKMVDCLTQVDNWKANVKQEGFVPALANALVSVRNQEHCTRLILPIDTGSIKEQVACAECKRPMEKFVLYRCCKD